jgi:5'-nucleotidase
VGINFGVNPGYDVTYSGTVGAALEAGAFGIPSIAAALDMDPAYHLTGEDSADYAVSKALTQRLARHLLTNQHIPGVFAWNLNIPQQATVQTPWRLTRLSRFRYYRATVPQAGSNDSEIRYRVLDDLSEVERDSDIWALAVDHVVSLTPLSLDLTWKLPEAASVFFGHDAWDSLDNLQRSQSTSPL